MQTVDSISSEFFKFASKAERSIWLLSAFIKVDALALLLEHIPVDVSLTVIVRWRLGDIITGATDAGIFELLQNRGAVFLFDPRLHIKTLVVDGSHGLVGSANLTLSGLGLREHSNIEGVYTGELDPAFVSQISDIIRTARPVTREMFEAAVAARVESEKELAAQAARIKQQEAAYAERFAHAESGFFVSDCVFVESPAQLAKNAQADTRDVDTAHDLRLLGISKEQAGDEASLVENFRRSRVFLWADETLPESILFGGFSALLHNALRDDPRPYRKDVKRLVSNLFTWLTATRNWEIQRHEHSQSLRRVSKES